MNSIIEFFPVWTQALGWTLLNSLWQAMIVTLLVAIALRLIPSRMSHIRYVVACAGMAFTVLFTAATFIYLSGDGGTAKRSELPYPGLAATAAVEEKTSVPAQELFSLAMSELASNMPLIILCWCAGAIFFSLRMISGWWYISKLRTESFVMTDAWSERLQVLAGQLGINRVVTLAQSARIHSPMVIGCLKPIVLVPAGMLAGLSTEQVETIFVHELAHIRRHDYIINLIQSFIEALFFFNPFVWIISGIIRREREYCCDDTVITNHGSKLAYAQALARLEESRLMRAAFALSLAENKNQLLNRIKRMMEKSSKNYSGRDRLIPAMLLVVGLICASWLTITTDGKTRDATTPATQVAADTVIKKNERSGRYSRRSVTTYDEKGQPHEEVVESYDGDEEMREALAPLMAFDFAMPPVPVEPFLPPAFPDLSGFEIPVPPGFRLDTIPAFHYRSGEEWKEFSRAFEKKFREHFSDFYKSNEKDFEKMMRELEENFSHNFEHEWVNNIHDMALADLAEEKAVKEMEISIQQMAEQALEAEARVREQMSGQMEDLKALEADMKRKEADMRAEMLIEDGYLGKNEKLETINWRSDNVLEVNGKSIKKADREKYNEVRQKYFRKSSIYRYVE
jgi:bla regulator protein blaR1